MFDKRTNNLDEGCRRGLRTLTLNALSPMNTVPAIRAKSDDVVDPRLDASYLA